jgi:UDP-N-acetylmuramoyl-L-alanyl-D-glutamate--2,6-diaminopimelate ligase
MNKIKLIKYIEKLKEEELLVSYNVDEGIKDTIIEKVTYDSRKVIKNTLFICKGINFKEKYLQDATTNGAIAYISEKNYNLEHNQVIIVNDIRKAIAIMISMYYDNPQEKINMIGITGTKGKSSTAYYIKYILDDYMKDLQKQETAIISSIDTYDGKTREEAVLTTPEAEELLEHIHNANETGIENLVMEVCSQALKTKRVYGILYNYGVFLNISEDHISDIEHPDYEDYFQSKLKLFEQTQTAIVNLNTKDLDRVLQASSKSKKTITFGTDETAMVYGYNIKKDGLNTIFNVKTSNFESEFILTMPGLFNVENALAAIAVTNDMGIPLKKIYNGIKNARVSGRMEVYPSKDNDVIVVVDYAHNKLSFEELYKSTIKEYPDRKIVTVFGCPGNHAINRRKDLGLLAGKYSEINYLTTEDPRFEEPYDICVDIAKYIEQEHGKYEIVVDRGEAIRKAIFDNNRNSVILVTGKGNETVQYIKGKYVETLTDVDYVKASIEELNNLKVNV